MKKSKFILLFFVVTFSMNYCSKKVDVVSMDEFQNKILDQKTVILDVRTEEEYFGPLGHIEGSILIPINELENRLNELHEYKKNTIYVVCRSGNRSGLGKDILNENNFTAVNVDGGMLNWKVDKSERKERINVILQEVFFYDPHNFNYFIHTVFFLCVLNKNI